MKIGRWNLSTRRKPTPAPLCSSEIPLDQTRDRTRAAAVGSQRLAASAMARPSVELRDEFQIELIAACCTHCDKETRRFGVRWRFKTIALMFANRCFFTFIIFIWGGEDTRSAQKSAVRVLLEHMVKEVQICGIFNVYHRFHKEKSHGCVAHIEHVRMKIGS
jgi:hypothetical protein